MSNLRFLKRKQSILKQLIFCIGFALSSAFLVSQPALAGPQQTTDKQEMEETTDNGLEKTEDGLEETQTIIQPLPEEPTLSDEGTSSPITVITRKPLDGEVADAGQYKCYDQPDGSIECVCETNESCEALKSAEICSPDTEWGKEDGFGGCTKKTE